MTLHMIARLVAPPFLICSRCCGPSTAATTSLSLFYIMLLTFWLPKRKSVLWVTSSSGGAVFGWLC